MASKQRKNLGRLTVGITNRAGGRKIDTWTFHSGADGSREEGRNAKPIVFDVAVLNTLEFEVDTKSIPKQRWPKPLVGAVLKDLHQQALDAARAEFDLANGLVWSDWLEVKVEEASRHKRRDNEGCAQASVSYTPIARAETPDGRALTIHSNGVLVDFPTAVGVDREADEMMGRRRKDPQIMARLEQDKDMSDTRRLRLEMDARDSREPTVQFVYLPDTPENRAGLDAIILAIDGINVRLQQFLAPDTIENTLQRAVAGAGRLLAAPEEPGPSPKKPSP